MSVMSFPFLLLYKRSDHSCVLRPQRKRSKKESLQLTYFLKDDSCSQRDIMTYFIHS